MKVCCAWCGEIYMPKDQTRYTKKSKVFCTNGCRDADNMFEELVLKNFPDLPNPKPSNVRRLPKPRK